jgi:hypothetical protein
MKGFFFCLNFQGKVEIGALHVVYHIKIVEIQQDSWVIQMEKDNVLLLVESNKGTLSHEIINECQKVCYFVKHFQ